MIKSYTIDVLNMSFKVHVTSRYDANVHIGYRRRDKKITCIHGIQKRRRSVLSVKNVLFSLVTVNLKVILKHPFFNGTYT